MRVWRWLLLSHALGQHPHEHVLYVNEECGRADATSAAHGAWRCADGSALPPPVVVVGSDGSGTRVVAKALSLMGVTMLVERALYTQMDLDGSDAGVHFTSTIRALLAAAHSSVYDPLSLPTAARSSAQGLVRPFAALLARCGCASRHGLGRRLWGFKKPDCMNLVPSLREALPGLQLVHVVRDGRDMAFSKNTAGVSKYASSLFAAEACGTQGSRACSEARRFQSLQMPAQSIAVWQKLNLDLALWAEARSSGRDAWYHRLRIEDISIDGSDRQIALPALAALASFAGANASACDLCAILRRLHDRSLGSHDRHATTSERKKQSQFGKWRFLADNATQQALTSEASRALAHFRYAGADLVPPPPAVPPALLEEERTCRVCDEKPHIASRRRRRRLLPRAPT